MPFLKGTGEGLVLERRATDHKAKILIMEDDPALVRLLSLNLEGEGYTVHSAGHGIEGLRLAFEEKPDLVVLDIMMPVMDGWGVCQRLREVSDVPILMLTCRSDLRDKVRGLSMGADDYLPKPFDMEELLLRIEALLRRSKWQPYVARPTTFDDGNLLVSLETREVRCGKERVELTPTEFRLLACFIRNPGRVLSKEYLLSQVWGPEYVEALHYVKIYVRHLRRKIEDAPTRPRYILTERGVGYRFVPQAASGDRSSAPVV